ncbi:hypothetical protein AB0D11_44055 [Streptomyces monashensis]
MAGRARHPREVRDCVGLYGVPGARITLTDEGAGEQLAAWPDEA